MRGALGVPSAPLHYLARGPFPFDPPPPPLTGASSVPLAWHSWQLPRPLTTPLRGVRRSIFIILASTFLHISLPSAWSAVVLLFNFQIAGRYGNVSVYRIWSLCCMTSMVMQNMEISKLCRNVIFFFKAMLRHSKSCIVKSNQIRWSFFFVDSVPRS